MRKRDVLIMMYGLRYMYALVKGLLSSNLSFLLSFPLNMTSREENFTEVIRNSYIMIRAPHFCSVGLA